MKNRTWLIILAFTFIVLLISGASYLILKATTTLFEQTTNVFLTLK